MTLMTSRAALTELERFAAQTIPIHSKLLAVLLPALDRSEERICLQQKGWEGAPVSQNRVYKGLPTC